MQIHIFIRIIKNIESRRKYLLDVINIDEQIDRSSIVREDIKNKEDIKKKSF